MDNIIIPQLFDKNNEWSELHRNEILEFYEKQVFGIMPTEGYEVTHTIISSELTDKGQKELWEIEISSNKGVFKYPLYVYFPLEVKEPLPFVIYVGNRPKEDMQMSMPPTLSSEVMVEVFKAMGEIQKKEMNKDKVDNSDSMIIKGCDLSDAFELDNWPVEEILSRGIATAAYYTEDLEPDYYTDLKQGIIEFLSQGKLESSSGKAISAWAFGARRALDCLLKDSRIDSENIGIAGHSRGGKTAIWSTVLDNRITACFSNNSGCTGAAISRGKRGEQIFHINNIFPYWFCDNYTQYNKNENLLPVDQHMLLGLIAPRLLYVTSASEDLWADPEAEFKGVLYASPAWEQCGEQGLAIEEMPAEHQPSKDGKVGYHLRKGEHAITLYDWKQFLGFWGDKINS